MINDENDVYNKKAIVTILAMSIAVCFLFIGFVHYYSIKVDNELETVLKQYKHHKEETIKEKYVFNEKLIGVKVNKNECKVVEYKIVRTESQKSTLRAFYRDCKSKDFSRYDNISIPFRKGYSDLLLNSL